MPRSRTQAGGTSRKLREQTRRKQAQKRNRIKNYPGGPGSRTEGGEQIGPEPPEDQGGIGNPPSGVPGAGTGTGSTAAWSLFPGLPPADSAKAAELLKDDPTGQSALDYIRGTQWYAHEYAGIQQGMASGALGNYGDDPEGAYRDYKQKVRSSYGRYYGRQPTEQEVASMLAQGWDAATVDKKGEGFAYVGAHGGDIQYAMSAFGGGGLGASDLTTLGEQSVGLQSTLGASLQDKLTTAMTKIEKAFQGTAGSNLSLEQSLGNTLQRRQNKDIGA